MDSDNAFEPSAVPTNASAHHRRITFPAVGSPLALCRVEMAKEEEIEVARVWAQEKTQRLL